MRSLVIFSAAFAAAVALSVYLLSNISAAVLGIIFFVAVFGFFLLSGKKRRIYILICAGISLGFLYCFAYTSIFISPALKLQDVQLDSELLICSYPEESYGRLSSTVKIVRGSAPDIKAKMYWDNTPDAQLVPGDLISAHINTRSAKDGHLYSSGVILNVYASDISIISHGNYNLTCLGSAASHRVKNMIDSVFPSDTKPFAKALITGDKAELYDSRILYTALQNAGLAHIVAVSGMHLSFVMSLLGIFVKNRRRFSVLGIPLIIFFMAFTGFSPSVCRAGIMYIFILSANFAKRESDSLTSLFASLFLLLLTDPFSISSVSLQLSFASCLGIILMYGRIHRVFSKKIAVLPKILIKPLQLISAVISITVSALLFTVPITALYFGYVPLAAPVAAVLVMPVLSLTFTLCAVACAFGFIWIPSGAFFALIASWLLRFISKAAVFVSHLPFSIIYTGNVWIAVWLVCTYLIIISFIVAKLSLRRFLLPACISVVGLCAAIVIPIIASPETALSMTALDVGQGQCIVITSGKCTAVIDCGSSSDGNAGKTAAGYLRSQGINNIDLLILTHYHADHINGADELLLNIGASAIILPSPDDTTEIDDDIISLAASLGSNIIYSEKQMSINFGDAMINIYPPVTSKNENERCSAVLCTENNFDILITGDMPAYCEMQLIDSWHLPDVEILVAGHHGASTSTCVQLLEAVRPDTVVISVGENSYGHPTDELLLRLSQHGAAVFRTDISGNITISSTK